MKKEGITPKKLFKNFPGEDSGLLVNCWSYY